MLPPASHYYANPASLARRALSRFVKAQQRPFSDKGKARKKKARRKKSSEGSEKECLLLMYPFLYLLSICVHVAMSGLIVFNLSHVDVDNVQRSWPKLEKLLLPIGIRVFISILEKRCDGGDRMPVCRQRHCCDNRRSPRARCCPTQVTLYSFIGGVRVQFDCNYAYI